MELAAVLAFLKRMLPALAGVALVVGLIVWHGNKADAAIAEAVKANNDSWELEAARLREVAAENAAEASKQARTALVAQDALKRKDDVEANAYYARRGPAVQCLTADRLRAISEADRRVFAATDPG